MLLPSPDPIPPLANAVLSANCFGLNAATRDGDIAYLAIVDEQGKVLEAGDHVARASWLLMLIALQNFLEGMGHIKNLTPTAPVESRQVDKEFFMTVKRILPTAAVTGKRRRRPRKSRT